MKKATYISNVSQNTSLTIKNVIMLVATTNILNNTTITITSTPWWGSNDI